MLPYSCIFDIVPLVPEAETPTVTAPIVLTACVMEGFECLNGGGCVSDGSDGNKCECSSPYVGQTCASINPNG